MKTIKYKGATITIQAVETPYVATMFANIRAWFNVRGAGRFMMFNLPSAQPATTLRYIRKRIKASLQ